MKKKFSLLLNIATICLCVCAIAIGVWSAKSAQMAVSGNIGFTAHNCDVVATTYIQNAIRKDANDEWEKIVGTQAQWSSQTDNTNASIYVSNNDSYTFGSIYFDDWFEDVATTIRIKIKVANYSLFPVSARVKTLSVGGTPVADFDNIYETDNYALVALHNDYIRAATKSGDTITPFEDQMVIEITLLDHQESFDLQAFSFGVEFAQTQTPSVNDGYTFEDAECSGETFGLAGVPEWTEGSSKHITLPSQVIDEEGNVVSLDYYIAWNSGFPGIDEYTTFTISAGLYGHIWSQNEFDNLENLVGALLPEDTTYLNNTFVGCYNLLSITVPKNVELIGMSGGSDILSEHNLDWGAKHLYVEEGNSVYYSKNNCIFKWDGPTTLFQGCENSIIPEGTTTIGVEAFFCVPRLISITLPDGLMTIGSYAFSGCPNLTSITIPSSVTSIGGLAFDDCSNLTSITYQGTKAQWSAIDFGDRWNNGTGNYTIHCTDGDIAKG
ncbi:MAG: leucine-rich repeat domain-containing protein [Clostridiales bacterium]|nr:leucine-rich repeat domain-containing protein [Clostridiales bacterium]